MAQSKKPIITKPDAWIIPIKPDLAQKGIDDGMEGGTYYLLFDVQENIEQQASYYHYAYKIVNADGVQNMSDVSFDFDPSYQKLYFHTIQILRNGKVIDILKNHEFQSLRRESDMERFMYDGTITNTMNIKDIRVGDVLEIAYTQKGYNPLLRKKVTTAQALNYSVPLHRLYYSVLSPLSRSLQTTYDNPASPKPKETTEGNYKRYAWDLKDLKAVEVETGIPFSYSPYQSVTLSEYKNWAEVVEWALPLYQTSSSDLAQISRLYGEKIDSTDDLSIIKAIRFVQDEIRYLGFEMGVSGYKPNTPAKVFNNRFGDCKDKSMLLVSLLRSNGIKAYPMLINTTYTSSTINLHPSPHAFNHCVVYMELYNKPYYVDPTINYQGGSINNLSFPRYGYGLIIRDGETELHKIKPSQLPTVYIREYYNIHQVGGATDFRILTDYDGSQADFQRSYFAANSSNSVAKAYLDYYGLIYSKINATEKFKVIDNDRDGNNTLSVEEFYRIEGGLWKDNPENSNEWIAEFYPMMITSMLQTLNSSNRKMPYYAGEPIIIRQETQINLPETWNITPSFYEINHPCFDYSFSAVGSGQQITINYSYSITNEIVSVNQYADFYSKQEELKNHTSYQLYKSKSGNGYVASKGVARNKPFTVGLLVSILLFIGMLIGSIIAFINYNPSPKPSTEEYNLIGGGLIAVAIGICLNPLFYLVDVFSSLGNLLDIDATETGLVLLSILSLSLDVILLVTSVFLLIVFFSRRTSTYTVFIIMLILWTLASCLNIWLAMDADRDFSYYTKEVFRILFTGIMWLPFFILSERRNGTFTVEFKK